MKAKAKEEEERIQMEEERAWQEREEAEIKREQERETRCQFHQHFTRGFFVQKSKSSFSVLKFWKSAQKLRIKWW